MDQFCDLVRNINEKNDYLDKEESNFYAGGHTFEEVYAHDMEELKLMKNRLERSLRFMSSPRRVGGYL